MNYLRISLLLLVAVVVLGFAAACQQGSTESAATKAADIGAARAALEKMAEGGKVGSEVGIVMRVARELKKTDPAKGEALEKDGAELMKAMRDPAAAKAKAKEILDKLPPPSAAPAK